MEIIILHEKRYDNIIAVLRNISPDGDNNISYKGLDITVYSHYANKNSILSLLRCKGFATMCLNINEIKDCFFVMDVLNYDSKFARTSYCFKDV